MKLLGKRTFMQTILKAQQFELQTPIAMPKSLANPASTTFVAASYEAAEAKTWADRSSKHRPNRGPFADVPGEVTVAAAGPPFQIVGNSRCFLS